MQNSNIAMRPTEALAVLRQLHDAASIYANNAALNYDFRQMLPIASPEDEITDSK